MKKRIVGISELMSEITDIIQKTLAPQMAYAKIDTRQQALGGSFHLGKRPIYGGGRTLSCEKGGDLPFSVEA